MNIPIRYILSAIVTCLIVFTLTLSFTSEKEEVANAAPPLIIKLPEKESVIKEVSYNDVLVESEKLHSKKQDKEWKELFKEVEKPKPKPVEKKVVINKVEKVKETKKKVVVKKESKPKPKKKTPSTVTYNVSAYTANFESTQKSPGDPEYGITASGQKVQANHTLACPKELPFGTRVYIPKMNNTYTCLDRGGAIVGKTLDIYMTNLDDALAFGRQNLEVQIIK